MGGSGALHQTTMPGIRTVATLKRKRAENRCIERRVPDLYACRRRDHPTNMLVMEIPHFDSEPQARGDVA
jgi:hypothetical protein